MASSVGGSSSCAGGDPPSIWPTRLDGPAMEELHRYAPLVLPGCRLAKPWKVSKDGYATLGPPRRRRSVHQRTSAVAGNPISPGGNQRRPRGRALTPQPPPVALPVAPPEVELSPEQVVLRKDGDPNDLLGLLVTLRASQAKAAAAAATSREEAEIAVEIQAVAALATNLQPIIEEDGYYDDDDIDLDNLGSSSAADDGADGDDAVEGPDIVYLDECD
ncbi:hypothetical protein ZWY2020_003277 [Hordeum vulgare]|nr:hypothetical protein ZWY2020_003277 [Hordeum vulgare]